PEFASPKPPACTPSLDPLRAVFAAGAVPLPNPVLATTPRAPFAPPVPFPAPGPTGKSNEPRLAMFDGLSRRPTPRAPLGSPKPPVCTCCAGRFTVAFAAGGSSNTFVLTTALGGGAGAGAGAGAGRIGFGAGFGSSAISGFGSGFGAGFSTGRTGSTFGTGIRGCGMG